MEIRGLVEEIRAIKRYTGKEKSCSRREWFRMNSASCCRAAFIYLREEFSGSITLLAQGMPGEIFAEAFAAAGEPSLVTVEAARDTEVLWIHFGRMMRRSGPGRRSRPS